jgi:adiponectin receptor
MGSGKAALGPTAPSRWPTLISCRELPAWMRDNDYIETGYRPHLESMRACILSTVMYLHNETVNIWTHLLGFLFYLRLLLRLLPSVFSHSALPFLPQIAAPVDLHSLRLLGNAAIPTSATPEAVAHLQSEHARVLAPLLLSACVCLLLSALYHALAVRGPRVASLLAKLDFCGIALLISGHALSAVRVAFYCDPRAARAALAPVRIYSVLTGVAGVFAARAILAPSFSGSHARAARTVTFSALTSVGVVPMVHAGFMHDWSHPEYTGMLFWLGIAVVVYIGAAIIYATRVPECCRPGKHDLWCGSHQIMHVLVLCGVYVHYFGIHRALDYRLEVGCSRSPFNSF